MSGLRNFHHGNAFLSLMHDTCTFASHESLVGFSVAYISQTWKYSIVSLGMLPCGQSHESQHVSDLIKASLYSRYGVTASTVSHLLLAHIQDLP